MGTMSYCCMENTNTDMNVCLEVMEKAEKIEDLGNMEARFAKALYNKALLFIEEYERLTKK